MRNLSQNAHPEAAATLTIGRMILIAVRSVHCSLSSIAWSVRLSSLERSEGESTCGSASNLSNESGREEPSIHGDRLARNISGRRKAKECNQPGHLCRFSDSAKRRLIDDSVSSAFVRQKALSQIRSDEPWSD